MASLQLLLAVTWIQLVASVLSCPADTNNVVGVSSWCVRHYTTKMTFCDAIKTCHSHGEEMISKPVFDAMKAATGYDGASRWWVGLIDAVVERGTNKGGWLWMKDGQVTNETDGYFQPTEPNDEQQDCVTTYESSKNLRDAGCKDNQPFYCYADPTVQTTNPTKFSFEKSPITAYEQPDPGCWQTQTNVPSVFDCTINCFTFGPDCVGFYWNSARQECILLPYFDAVVPLLHGSIEEKNQWGKFMRTA